jgi:DNA-binding CsgD family transcriptional regulator
VGASGVDLGLPGRDRELGEIAERLAGAGERGCTLVIRGEAGIGKSSLLEAARKMAHDLGMPVFETTGAQSESNLPFAGLHRLLRPCLTELDHLPEPQRTSVQAAFGLTDAAVPDTFLIALAALDLLSELASTRPLLLLVEDAQWLDEATRDVLAFVGRRLELEPIVMLFAVRDGAAEHVDPLGLPELRLAGLEEAVAATLLDANAPDLAVELRRRVLEEAAGNPLALAELPRAMGTDPALSPETPLPLTERLEQAFAARTTDLSTPTQALLLVAALDDHGGLRELVDGASILHGGDVSDSALTEAVDAEVIRLATERVQFRHPLIRSAIYQQASPRARRAAHAALATVYADDPDRRAWHRAASLSAPDEGVAAELEAAAERASTRGASAVAASGLIRAAQLSTDVRRRGHLLIRAGELQLALGRRDLSVRFFKEAQQLELESHERTRLAFLLETLDQNVWSGATTASLFIEIAGRLLEAGDAGGALEALLTVSLRCWWGNPDQATRDLVTTTAERLPVPGDSPPLLATLALADPLRCGAAVIERIAATAPATGSDPSASFLLGSSAMAVWAFDLADGFLATSVDGFRTGRQLGVLVQALSCQAWTAALLSNTSLAGPAAADCERLGEETGQPLWAMTGSLAGAVVAAERGETSTALELAADAERVILPLRANPMLSLVQFVRGRASLVDASFTDACDHLRRVFDPDDVAYHPYVAAWVFADFVDAATHGGGSIDEARSRLAEVESMAAVTGASFLRAQVSYGRALLGPEEEAEPLFRSALATELAGWPGLRARMLLSYGSWLRRQRRVAESRSPLRGAVEAFCALGCVKLAERAEQELRASGETPRRRTSDQRDQLTPQELQIAQMAADGLTNREIGQKLFLSHRTVGSHLYRIFPKVGVTARSQLRDVLHELTSA